MRRVEPSSNEPIVAKHLRPRLTVAEDGILVVVRAPKLQARIEVPQVEGLRFEALSDPLR